MTHIEVSRSVELGADPGEVWAELSPFSAIDRWHPAVKSSFAESIDEIEHRRLTTLDGAEILERLLEERVSRSQRYAIVESPLPVADYESQITLEPIGMGRTRLTWSGRFTPTNPAAEQIVAGIYETGLEALRAKLGD